MLKTKYTTEGCTVPIPVQRSMFGPDKYLADSKQKLAQLYYKNPEIANIEKNVILSYWQAYDNLDDIIGDKKEEFREWFFKATSPETITRSLRALKEDGTIQLSQEKQNERQEREQQHRTFWGNQASFRQGNEQK